LSRLLRSAATLFLLTWAALAAAAYGQAPSTRSHPAQRHPDTADFPTGPAIGERLPDFTLTNQRGETIDFHADRGGHKAAVVFQRSAVW
jgi:cytochrome oxidase Cu insertion factor (SCO1/SenC/PrrC family)